MNHPAGDSLDIFTVGKPRRFEAPEELLVTSHHLHLVDQCLGPGPAIESERLVRVLGRIPSVERNRLVLDQKFLGPVQFHAQCNRIAGRIQYQGHMEVSLSGSEVVLGGSELRETVGAIRVDLATGKGHVKRRLTGLGVLGQLEVDVVVFEDPQLERDPRAHRQSFQSRHGVLADPPPGGRVHEQRLLADQRSGLSRGDRRLHGPGKIDPRGRNPLLEATGIHPLIGDPVKSPAGISYRPPLFLQHRLLDIRASPRVPTRQRQVDRTDRREQLGQEGRHTRGNRSPLLVLVAFIPASVKPGLGIRTFVENPNHADPHGLPRPRIDVRGIRRWIWLARHAVLPHSHRFEESPHAEIVFVRDRIVLVVVTMRAIEGQPQEGLTGVFDRVPHPVVGIQREVVADQVPGGRPCRIVGG